MSKVTKNNRTNQIDFSATSITAFKPTGLIEYYDHNGSVVTSVLTCALIMFIEKNDLAFSGEVEQGALTFSGSYDSQPEYESIPVEIPAMDYLDQNFEYVTEMFYNEVLLAGRSLSHAA